MDRINSIESSTPNAWPLLPTLNIRIDGSNFLALSQRMLPGIMEACSWSEDLRISISCWRITTVLLLRQKEWIHRQYQDQTTRLHKAKTTAEAIETPGGVFFTGASRRRPKASRWRWTCCGGCLWCHLSGCWSGWRQLKPSSHDAP